MKLSLLHKNVNTSSHRKGNLLALTAVYQFELWLKVRDMPSKLSWPRQRPWSLVWVKQAFKLSEVELTEFHCTTGITQWPERQLLRYDTGKQPNGTATPISVRHPKSDFLNRRLLPCDPVLNSSFLTELIWAANFTRSLLIGSWYDPMIVTWLSAQTITTKYSRSMAQSGEIETLIELVKSVK